MNDDPPLIRYIALVNTLKHGDKWVAEPAQISYAFHTFSLRNEHVYELTGDVSFVSPNTNPRDLDGGIERLINAVLHLTVKVFVVAVDTAEQLREQHAPHDTIEVSPGFSRSYEALHDLITQAYLDHPEHH